MRSKYCPIYCLHASFQVLKSNSQRSDTAATSAGQLKHYARYNPWSIELSVGQRPATDIQQHQHSPLSSKADWDLGRKLSCWARAAETTPGGRQENSRCQVPAMPARRLQVAEGKLQGYAYRPSIGIFFLSF